MDIFSSNWVPRNVTEGIDEAIAWWNYVRCDFYFSLTSNNVLALNVTLSKSAYKEFLPCQKVFCRIKRIEILSSKYVEEYIVCRLEYNDTYSQYVSKRAFDTMKSYVF